MLNISASRWFLSLVVVLCALVLPMKVYALERPSLIVTEDMYEDLRARSDTSPWLEMKNDAIVKSSQYLSPSEQHFDVIRESISSSALCYILDTNETNKTIYKDRITSGIGVLKHLTDVNIIGPDNWLGQVWPGGAIFNAILAFDIIYNDLGSEKYAIESDLDDVVGAISYVKGWPLNLFGLKATWELFRNGPGDINNPNTEFMNFKAVYTMALKDWYTSSDGVFREGPNYGWSRLSSAEDAKTHSMDVFEFNGYHDYYSAPNLIAMYEWLYGSAIDSIGYMTTFGDTDARYYRRGQDFAAIFRASRFSHKAAQYASWCNDGAAPSGLLLHYLLTDEPLPAPKKAQSRIFNDGGAFFKQADPCSMSLDGSLWNYKNIQDIQAGHSHKEINAIQLTAYGEKVLQNSGYNGFENSQCACGYKCSWPWIHSQAEASSCMLIDGVNHAVRYGGGIVDGLVSGGFDYASGYSGLAMPNGEHWRNFVFVHPQDDKNGYWVLFDEIKADSGSATANLVLHPDSELDPNVLAGQTLEHKWTIRKFQTKDTFLNVFMATVPSLVTIDYSVIASRGWGITGAYTKSDYPIDPNGIKNIVTVLFPSDADHAKADMSRISASTCSGAVIDHGDSVIDFAVQNDSNDVNVIVEYDEGIFKAGSVLVREIDNVPVFYFARKSKSFSWGQYINFETDLPVSFHIRQNIGTIICANDVNASVYIPGASAVIIDGNYAEVTYGPDETMVFAIAGGTHSIEFTNPGSDIPGDLTNDGCVDFYDLEGFVEEWLNEDCIANGLCGGADLDESDRVDMADFAVIAEHWYNCSVPGDIDGDGCVDSYDLELLIMHWLEDECLLTEYCHGADINMDGKVNLLDFAVLIDNWQNCF